MGDQTCIFSLLDMRLIDVMLVPGTNSYLIHGSYYYMVIEDRRERRLRVISLRIFNCLGYQIVESEYKIPHQTARENNTSGRAATVTQCIDPCHHGGQLQE
jgi:hypothetical protein